MKLAAGITALTFGVVLGGATGLDDLRADYRGGENRSLTAIEAVESDPSV